MTDEPINGVADLREEMAALIRRYVQHLDFDAPKDLTTVRIEATGPGLHVAYAEHDSNPPMLNVQINDFANTPEPPEDMEARNILGRRK